MVWSGIPIAITWLVMGLSINSAMIYVSSFCLGLFASISWTQVGKMKIYYIKGPYIKDVRKNPKIFDFPLPLVRISSNL